MDFQTYRPLALRTAKMFPTQIENMRHVALGLLTEIGEFATEVKRIEIYGKPMTAEMREHMIEELGDFQWYLPLGFMCIGADPRYIIETEKIRPSIESLTFSIAASVGTIAAIVELRLIEEERSTMIDLLSALQLLCDRLAVHLNIDAGEVRARNIEKLRLRYPDTYTDVAAEARADKAGADARNS